MSITFNSDMFYTRPGEGTPSNVLSAHDPLIWEFEDGAISTGPATSTIVIVVKNNAGATIYTSDTFSAYLLDYSDPIAQFRFDASQIIKHIINNYFYKQTSEVIEPENYGSEIEITIKTYDDADLEDTEILEYFASHALNQIGDEYGTNIPRVFYNDIEEIAHFLGFPNHLFFYSPTDLSGEDPLIGILSRAASGFIAAYNGTDAQGTDYRIGIAYSDDRYNWVKAANNPILSPVPATWEHDNTKDPSLLLVNGIYYLYYTGFNAANTTQIGLATSLDGINWTKYADNPVITFADTNNIPRFSVAYYDEAETDAAKRWKIWYTDENYDIGYAYSSDGYTWTKFSGNPVLERGAGGQWDDSNIFPGIIYYDSGTFYLYYGGKDGTDWLLGLATFTDPEGAYTKSGNNPLISNKNAAAQSLTADLSTGNKIIQVADTSAFVDNEYVWLFDDDSDPQLNRIDTVDSGVQITLFDDATADYTQAQNALVRSYLYRSIIPRSIWQDGSEYVLAVSIFQALDDLGAFLREHVGVIRSSSLDTGWTHDIDTGLILSFDTGEWDALSAENLSAIPGLTKINLSGTFGQYIHDVNLSLFELTKNNTQIDIYYDPADPALIKSFGLTVFEPCENAVYIRFLTKDGYYMYWAFSPYPFTNESGDNIGNVINSFAEMALANSRHFPIGKKNAFRKLTVASASVPIVFRRKLLDIFLSPAVYLWQGKQTPDENLGETIISPAINPYETLTTDGTIVISAINTIGDGQLILRPQFTVKKGDVIIVILDLTVNSGANPIIRMRIGEVGAVISNLVNLSPGFNTAILISTGDSDECNVFISNTTATNFSTDKIIVKYKEVETDWILLEGVEGSHTLIEKKQADRFECTLVLPEKYTQTLSGQNL